MANETIKIGCRLPNGYVLEVGLQTTVRGGPKDGLISLVKKRSDYQRKVLHGTHAHNAKLLLRGIRLPSELNPEPYINTVSKDLWERWRKEHADAAVVKTGQLFEIADPKDVKAVILDVMASPAPLAPMDPTKIFKNDDNKVETADFDEK
jgi:hypothetical protein